MLQMAPFQYNENSKMTDIVLDGALNSIHSNKMFLKHWSRLHLEGHWTLLTHQQ